MYKLDQFGDMWLHIGAVAAWQQHPQKALASLQAEYHRLMNENVKLNEIAKESRLALDWLDYYPKITMTWLNKLRRAVECYEHTS